MKTKTLTLKIATLCLSSLIGCAFQKSGPNLSSPAYYNATPENKARIATGKCGIGMTIDECRAAWPTKYFEWVDSYTSSNTKYETWRVEHYPPGKGLVWLYLETKDGRITSGYETTKPSPRRIR
ncbi:MAG: hypothetical protein A3K30_03135 [Deltaproteobacteria bacterium RBG_13_51_10]|nr:MAG: hypothetical protein A3K30_03135 [Deltaproteobacteria bacterium RBG_13_51_10]